MNVWEQIREYLQKKVSAESYNNWLRGTSFLGMEGDTVFVSAPDRETRAWLESEYTPIVRAAIQELGLGVRHVSYECAIAPAKEPAANSGHADTEWESTNHPLNPKFTFDSFVVGASNQFAHAAAKSVARNPSRSYNPLFIYGGVGMGKTHLMHAIGRSLMDHYATMRVIYTSTERFMNEMISCIRTERMQNFHQRYREADVLLIDDIQMLGSKERTQEEFFHTFNDLHEHQKQIVISSDAPPRDIPGLVERLRSRFEWGLIADIQPPDLETKMAILDKKSEAEGVKLPDDVRTFMAGKTKSNVRELEGALVKLIAYADLTGAADEPADGAAGTQKPATRAGAARHHRRYPEGGRRSLPDQAIAAQGKEQHESDRLSAPDCHVPGEGADPGLPARDRTGVRRQAPHHRNPLD